MRSEDRRYSRALGDVPAILREAGLAVASPRPRVGWRDPSPHPTGGKPIFQTTRRPSAEAWTYPFVEHGTAGAYAGVFLDVDQTQPMELLKLMLREVIPVPTLWMARESNGHSAMGWLLANPVGRHHKASWRPQALFTRVSEHLGTVTNADSGYTGSTFRNYDQARIDPRFFTAMLHGAYGLLDLASHIPPGWRAPTKPRTYVGRSHHVYRELLRFAGRYENRNVDLRDIAMNLWAEMQGVDADHPYTISEAMAQARGGLNSGVWNGLPKAG